MPFENFRRRDKFSEVKFILPTAPTIPITCNFGMRMPGWYDIVALGGSAETLLANEDEPGILSSQSYFHGLIQQEIDAGIPSDRIVIGGFSQGGAMSIFSGLTAPVKLGGIIGLSSYLALSRKFKDIVPKENLNKETPVFMAHGDADPVVLCAIGQLSYEMLKELGYAVEMKTYRGMGHAACPEELDEVEAFLMKRLPPTGDRDEL